MVLHIRKESSLCPSHPHLSPVYSHTAPVLILAACELIQVGHQQKSAFSDLMLQQLMPE